VALIVAGMGLSTLAFAKKSSNANAPMSDETKSDVG